MDTTKESTAAPTSEEEYVRSRAANLLAENDPDTFGSPTDNGEDDEDENKDVSTDDAATPADEDFPLDDEDGANAGENEDDDELDDEEPGMELDEELAKNPKLAKRWQEQQKGLEKLVKRSQTLNTEMGNFHQLMKALENPQSVEKAFDFLADQLGQLHGISLKRTTTSDVDNDGDEVWEREGFQSPGEYRAYQRALQEARKEREQMQREIAPELEEVRGLRKDREARATQEATAKKLAKAAPMVANRLAAEENGFAVTEEMVRKAYDNFPNHRTSVNKLAEAVAMQYRKEIAKHHVAKVETKATRRDQAPDMTKGGKNLKGSHASAQDVTMDDMIALARAKFAQ